VCLLELLPDPRLDRGYRFRAEVRHDEGSFLSDVGVYWGYSKHPSAEGVQEFFCTLGFNDQKPRVKLLRSNVVLRLQRCNDQGGAERAAPLRQLPFAPVKQWRRLAVEVTPEAFGGSWDGKQLPAVSRAELLASSRSLRVRHLGLSPDFSPRDGLGLYLNAGSASFRRVVVEPLP
jgi:hypothetical protein